ncbi:MAG: hypothetical protein ACYTGW_16740 [Planctomycetota bacterium]|jgi:hypothetical protein
MTTPFVTTLPLALMLATTTAAGLLPAQQLRRGIESADVLLVATCVRVQPVKNFVLHRLKISEVLRGEEFLKLADGSRTDHVTVIEVKRVSQHNKPVPARLRLYCLHDRGRQARKVALPPSFAPYFRMSGFTGTNPDLEKAVAKDSILGFAKLLVAAEKGLAPRRVSEQVFDIALRGDTRVRIEAVKILTEREVLLGYINQIQTSEVLTRAIGETDDIPYKVSLCDLCATKRVNNLVDRLCVSVQQTGDERFLRALGRIAKYMHKEEAANILMAHVARTQGKNRERFIYALGATSTEAALKALLKMHDSKKDQTSVEAALRVHGAPRALRAIKAKKPAPGKKSGQEKSRR